MSTAETTGNWIATIRSHLAADKRKTVALGALTLVMAVVWGRLFLRSASGAPAPVVSLSPALVAEVSAPAEEGRSSARPTGTRSWEAHRVRATRVVDIRGAERTLSRDYFAPDWSQFAPADGGELSAEHRRGSAGEVWDRLRASIRRERDRRRREAEMVQKQAAGLTVQSTIIGSPSSAVVSGRLVHVGEVVEGFEVEQIGSRSVVVRKDGVRVTIQMP